MGGEVRDEEVPRREGQGVLRRLFAVVLGRGALGHAAGRPQAFNSLQLCQRDDAS